MILHYQLSVKLDVPHGFNVLMLCEILSQVIPLPRHNVHHTPRKVGCVKHL